MCTECRWWCRRNGNGDWIHRKYYVKEFMRFYSRCELDNNNFPANSFEAFFRRVSNFVKCFFSIPEYFSRLSSAARGGRDRYQLDELLWPLIRAHFWLAGLFRITRRLFEILLRCLFGVFIANTIVSARNVRESRRNPEQQNNNNNRFQLHKMHYFCRHSRPM